MNQSKEQFITNSKVVFLIFQVKEVQLCVIALCKSKDMEKEIRNVQVTKNDILQYIEQQAEIMENHVNEEYPVNKNQEDRK